MLPNFYKNSLDYFERNLKYIDGMNEKIKSGQKILCKFQKYTKEYSSKLSEMFVEKKQSLEDYEILDEYSLLNSDNDKSKRESFDNNIFLFPFNKSLKRLHKFFDELEIYLADFIKNLENLTNGIEQYLNIIKKEIKSCKKSYETQVDSFKSKFQEYQSLNEELKNTYNDAENILIQFCYERRKDGIPYDINLKMSNKDLVIEQNKIIDKYHSLGNFEKEFLEETRKKIKFIQELTVTLFLKFENASKNIPNIFNMSISTPMNKLIEEITKTSQNEDFELMLKKDFDTLSNHYISNFDENNIKLKLEKYNIKAIENENIKIDDDNISEIKEKQKPKKKEKNNEKNKEKNPENHSSDEVIKLTEKETFFIVKNMYEDYELINKENYDLKIEEIKLKLGDKIKILLNYNEENKINDLQKKENDKNIEDKKGISKEDVDFICQKMSNFEYRKYFLMKINSFRGRDNLEMPNKIFDYIIQIFTEIDKYLFCFEEKDEKNGKIKDIYCLRLILILSQTFYTNINNERKYLSDELRKEKIFNISVLWKELIYSNIEDEFNRFFENLKKVNPNKDKNKINQYKEEIYFAQIIPFIGAMKSFAVKTEEIKNIINFIIKKYDIPEKISLAINKTI